MSNYFVFLSDGETFDTHTTSHEDCGQRVIPEELLSEGEWAAIHLDHKTELAFDVPSVTVAKMINELKHCGHWDILLQEARSPLQEARSPSLAPLPRPVSPLFRHQGLLPEGYEICVDGLPGDDSVNMRAAKIDGSWRGPDRNCNQNGFVIADAWKHVTASADADIVDEAGSR